MTGLPTLNEVLQYLCHSKPKLDTADKVYIKSVSDLQFFLLFIEYL